jgi:transposase
MLVRHYLEQGLTKAEIARLAGVAVRTVYHWIATGQLDRSLDGAPVRYRRRPAVACKTDVVHELVAARLAEFPRLTATRLFDEAKSAGYRGGYSQMKELVRRLRPQPSAEPVVRFETPAGRQAQVDFAEFRLPWGRRYALLVVLGYSRLLWLRFYPRQTLAVLVAGLEEAFGFFGGVPAELLFDQMRAVIVEDQREVGGRLLENAEFARFAAHHGFRIRACRPYRARTKGKVERPIGYVRQAFFYGRSFLNDEDLNAQADTWLREVANQRLHRTIGEPPALRFERDERLQLLPPAARPWQSLVPPPPKSPPPPRSSWPQVERRPLGAYEKLAGGAP